MKTKILSALVAAATLPISGALAQTPAAAPNAPAPAPATVAPAAPAPNQVVYVPRLPSAAELTTAASAQGLTVERIEQSGAQVTAFYKNANGQTNIVAYQLLPTGSAPTTATVVTPSPAPVVVDSAPRVVYYEPAYGYYPYYGPYWYPPVSVRLGFSYGYRGGFYRGGFGYRHFR